MKGEKNSWKVKYQTQLHILFDTCDDARECTHIVPTRDLHGSTQLDPTWLHVKCFVIILGYHASLPYKSRSVPLVPGPVEWWQKWPTINVTLHGPLIILTCVPLGTPTRASHFQPGFGWKTILQLPPYLVPCNAFGVTENFANFGVLYTYV